MNNRINKVIFSALFLSIVFCTPVFSKTLPLPVESKMLVVSGAGFNIITGYPEDTTYALFLKLKNSDNSSFFIEVEYENPCDIKQPFIENQKVTGSEKTINLTSQHFNFFCLKEGKTYKVKIKVYSDESKSNLLDELTQGIRSVNIRQLGKLMKK